MENTLTLSIPFRRDRVKSLLLAIVILAIFVRVGASLFLTNLAAQPQKDEWVFTNIAWNLASGHGYSANGELPTFLRPPGYPLLLAGVYAVFGQNWVIARIVNILISSLTVVVIYLIGRRLFNKNLGLIAALISAGLYPIFIIQSLRIVSDTFYVFMVSIVLLILTEIYNRPDAVKTQLLCGVALGLAILIRSELILFLPFLCIWAIIVYRRFYKALRTFVIILLPVVLFVLPWLIRNYIVFDKLVMSSNLGQVMWGVYNPNTFNDWTLMGGWTLPPEFNLRSESINSRDPGYVYIPEFEWHQTQMDLAFKTIKENIWLLPEMGFYKLDRLVFTPGPIRNFIRLPLLYGFFFGLILLLVLGDHKRFLGFYMFLLFVVCSTLIFYTNERLRMVIDPTFIIIASYGLSEQVKLIKNKAKINLATDLA